MALHAGARRLGHVQVGSCFCAIQHTKRSHSWAQLAAHGHLAQSQRCSRIAPRAIHLVKPTRERAIGSSNSGRRWCVKYDAVEGNVSHRHRTGNSTLYLPLEWICAGMRPRGLACGRIPTIRRCPAAAPSIRTYSKTGILLCCYAGAPSRRAGASPAVCGSCCTPWRPGGLGARGTRKSQGDRGRVGGIGLGRTG